MARIPLPFSSYQIRSTPASTSRLVNCCISALPAGAKTPTVLERVAGPKAFEDIGTGPIRGMHAFQGDLFVVSGTGLYKIESDGTATGYLGTPIAGTGSVSMAHNPDYLVIVAEPNGYIFDPGFGVGPITDIDFTSRGASRVKFCKNYMVFQEPDSGRFFWADVGSVSSYDSLNFATAEGRPDPLEGIESDQSQLIAFGEETVEIYNVTANGFESAINGVIEIGCFNGDTVCQFDSSVAWVANDYTVRILRGTTAQQISTPAVEQFLTSVDVSTLRAYAYSQDGHFFYVLCCSSGCFVYDVKSGEWAERATYPYDYYKWQYHAYAHGRHYIGDFYSDAVCYFDPLTYTDNGGIQRMSWRYQPIYAENRVAVHRSFEVVLEVGVGLTTGQGSDPEIMLAYSDDGGVTWTNLPNRKIGKMGEYRTRVRWSGLGSASQRVYECAVSDPVRIAVVDTIVDVEASRMAA